MSSLRHTLTLSDHWFPRMARRLRKGLKNFAVPAPRLITFPLVRAFLGVRWTYYFIARVFFCEPFFKAHCTKYGRNVHTGSDFHWIFGGGELMVGDNVLVDGKCGIGFTNRYSALPTLEIGNNTGIGHACRFTIGKRITIGRNCRIAQEVQIFDSPGHPADPAARMAGLPAADEDVRPVAIGDNVWIGNNAIVMPGVTIGHGSVVAAGSVVMTDVLPNTLVAGNPARQIRALVKTA